MRSARKLWNESGSIIVALPLIVLFCIVLMVIVEVAQSVAAGDVVLKKSVALAAKAAASQYDRESLQIEYQQAIKAFERTLSENLELKKNLKPEKYSAFTGQPEYTLIIYNGQQAKKKPAGYEYIYRDGKLNKVEIPGEGFPRTFSISGGLEITLGSPGAIAEVTIDIKKVFGSDLACKRWAAARITENGIVVLQGSSG